MFYSLVILGFILIENVLTKLMFCNQIISLLKEWVIKIKKDNQIFFILQEAKILIFQLFLLKSGDFNE